VSYVTLAEFKQAIDIADPVDDTDLQRALDAASDWIDHYCGRTFSSVDPSVSARLFLPYEPDRLTVPDLSDVTLLEVDTLGDSSFSATLEATDYDLLPFGVGYPGTIGGYTEIRLKANAPTWFIVGQQARVTAHWGYGTTPAGVQQATILLANRYFHRPSAPFSMWESPQTGELGSIATSDPDVAALLSPFVSSTGASASGTAWVLV